ncbi:hypothetical protein TYRP_004917 [Tyrophagus putrescentiae]|nr:hypothetical protein TYRP_004917 [Tyrophagus putrescentiae]
MYSENVQIRLQTGNLGYLNLQFQQQQQSFKSEYLDKLKPAITGRYSSIPSSYGAVLHQKAISTIKCVLAMLLMLQPDKENPY